MYTPIHVLWLQMLSYVVSNHTHTLNRNNNVKWTIRLALSFTISNWRLELLVFVVFFGEANKAKNCKQMPWIKAKMGLSRVCRIWCRRRRIMIFISGDKLELHLFYGRHNDSIKPTFVFMIMMMVFFQHFNRNR